MSFDSYIFDLDGTVLDTSLGIRNALNLLCDEFQIPRLTAKQVLEYVGPPLPSIILKMYPQVTEEQVQRGTEIYRHYFQRKGLYEAYIYDGMLDLLGYLKGQGRKLSLASLKYQEAVELSTKHFKLDGYFDAAFGSDLNGTLTKFELIEKCLQAMGNVDRNRTVMIGDSPFDAIGAQQSGIKFIAVTYGFGFKDERVSDYQPLFIADKVLDLYRYLV